MMAAVPVVKQTSTEYLRYCRKQSRRDPSFVRIIDEALPVEAGATDAKCEAKLDYEGSEW